jgi:NDP-sugar pyrophosphorylase family protein
VSPRQAVVLAAGRGTRLGALTAATPKPLLDLAGRPLLLRTLDALAAAGVERAIVVVGYLADRVAAALAADPVPGLRFELVHQQRLDGTARALALAAPALDPGPFFVTWGDVFVDPVNYPRLAAAAGRADGALLINEVDDPWAGAAVYLDETARVTRIVEKPPPGSSTTRWNNAGPAIYGPWLWPFVERLEPSPRGEYELPRAVAAAIEAGITIRAVPVEGPWFDIGTPESLAAARRYAESQPGGIVHP